MRIPIPTDIAFKNNDADVLWRRKYITTDGHIYIHIQFIHTSTE